MVRKSQAAKPYRRAQDPMDSGDSSCDPQRPFHATGIPSASGNPTSNAAGSSWNPNASVVSRPTERSSSSVAWRSSSMDTSDFCGSQRPFHATADSTRSGNPSASAVARPTERRCQPSASYSSSGISTVADSGNSFCGSQRPFHATAASSRSGNPGASHGGAAEPTEEEPLQVIQTAYGDVRVRISQGDADELLDELDPPAPAPAPEPAAEEAERAPPVLPVVELAELEGFLGVEEARLGGSSPERIAEICKAHQEPALLCVGYLSFEAAIALMMPRHPSHPSILPEWVATDGTPSFQSLVKLQAATFLVESDNPQTKLDLVGHRSTDVLGTGVQVFWGKFCVSIDGGGPNRVPKVRIKRGRSNNVKPDDFDYELTGSVKRVQGGKVERLLLKQTSCRPGLTPLPFVVVGAHWVLGYTPAALLRMDRACNRQSRVQELVVETRVKAPFAVLRDARKNARPTDLIPTRQTVIQARCRMQAKGWDVGVRHSKNRLPEAGDSWEGLGSYVSTNKVHGVVMYNGTSEWDFTSREGRATQVRAEAKRISVKF